MTATRIALTVAACAVVVHLGALWNHFAMDDMYIIVHNPLLREVASPWRIFASPYWPPEYFGGDMYRPLPVLTYALDRLVGPAAWFHAVNLAWHAGASVAAALFAHRLGGSRAAVVAGLLFAVHPVHVEAVANVIGRAELMAALFATASVWAALTDRSPAWSIAAFAVALFCKENAVVTPALIVWAWLVGIARPDRRRLLAFAAGWAVSLGVWGALRAAVLEPYAHLQDIAPVFFGQSPTTVRLTAVAAFSDVARLLLAPLVLRADYSPLERTAVLTPTDARFLLGVAVFAAWGLLLAAAWRRGRRLEVFGLGWVAIAVLPVSNLFVTTGVVVAERTLYLPSMGLVIAAGAALARMGDTRHLVALTAALVLAGGVRSALRVPVWRDDLRVVLSVLDDSPRSYRGYRYYGGIMLAARQPERALGAYREAIRIYPLDPAMLIAAADAALTVGQSAAADSFFALAEPLCIDCPSLYRFQATGARMRGDTAVARALLARVPERTPR